MLLKENQVLNDSAMYFVLSCIQDNINYYSYSCVKSEIMPKHIICDQHVPKQDLHAGWAKLLQ